MWREILREAIPDTVRDADPLTRVVLILAGVVVAALVGLMVTGFGIVASAWVERVYGAEDEGETR